LEGFPNSYLAPFWFSIVYDRYCLAFSWANSTSPGENYFLPAWMAVTLEGNYFAARMDFRALQINILQLFTKNTRRFLKISQGI
jgi:hypothetical protein